MMRYRKWVISLKIDHLYNYKDKQVLLFYQNRCNQQNHPEHAMQIKNKIAKKLLFKVYTCAAHFTNRKRVVLDTQTANPKMSFKSNRLDHRNQNYATPSRNGDKNKRSAVLYSTNKIEYRLPSKAVQSKAINSTDALFQGPLLALSIRDFSELSDKDNKLQLTAASQTTTRLTPNFFAFSRFDCKEKEIWDIAINNDKDFLLLGGIYKNTLYNPIQLQRLALLHMTVDRSFIFSDLTGMANPVRGYNQKLCTLLKMYISQFSQLCNPISKGLHEPKSCVPVRQPILKNCSFLHFCFQSKIVMLIKVLHVRAITLNQR